MAFRINQSPAVTILERDLSLIAPNNAGTNVFIAGFTPQGPTDEVLKITTRDELEAIYGVPTNSAERYFYYSVRELLNSPASIYTFRLPYGTGSGDGFGSEHSALVYPVKSYTQGNSYDSVSSFTLNMVYDQNLAGTPLSGAAFKIQDSTGAPKTVVFSINGQTPARSGNITVPVLSTSTFAQILTAISNTIPLSAPSVTVATTAPNTFTIRLSGYVPLVETPSLSSSVLAGLDDSGDIFTISSALSTAYSTTPVLGDNLDIENGVYFLGEPVQVKLSETQYQQALEGTLFDWSSTASARTSLSNLSAIGGAGVVVLDKAQTTINSQFEGYYVGLTDNVNLDVATDFKNITGIKSTSLTANAVGLGTNTYTNIPSGTLQFNLSSSSAVSNNSISRVMANLTDYDIAGREDDDLLGLGVFKLRKSVYATESFKLDYVVDDAIVGSIDSFRTQLNPTGGSAIPFFLESQDTNSRNVEILVNPYLSNKYSDTAIGNDGLPKKKIRVLTQATVTNYNSVSAAVGAPLNIVNSAIASINTADSLYPLGVYNPVKITQKTIGNVPTKINRALESVLNDEIYDIDVVVEAGLGTIFTMASAAGTTYYDDTLYNNTIKTKLDTLRTSNDIFNDVVATDIRGSYSAVFNQFENFCNLPVNTGGRGDCIFIADPIRHILVTGRNTKVLADRNNNFQQHVYWAMRHQFELENTSYAAAYANWVQVFEEFNGDKVWIPFSAFQGAIIARSSANNYPWSAPAGFNRGLLTSSALDLAINPNQKQRDELYKINLNPVMFSASQGMVVFGQKTMQRKPSAFDRINVRRLFQALERPTKKASQFFIFEPNTEFTRNRLVIAIDPIFQFAKQNDGLYDYLIICDERNNTPQVIDNNELKVDILIKPVRTAEYITVTFTATRTDAVFDELI